MSASTPEIDFMATLRALEATKDQLAATAEADFDRRQDLRDREAELRSQLRSFGRAAGDPDSIDQLKRSIKEVERRLEAHYGNRLSHTSGPQTGFGGGLDPKYLHKMNRAMDDAGDLSNMKAELSRLKDELRTLERS